MNLTYPNRVIRLALGLMAVAFLAGFTSCKTQTLTATQPAAAQAQQAPINMILDSDFGSSTDDLFALMMLNHYIDEKRVDLKGIIVDREGEKNAGVVDIFNTYYGHPDIPVGLERNGVKNPRCFIPYNGICDLKDAQGNPLFKRSFDASKCPDGYKLYRQLLSKADDNSVVVVAIGFVTTLAQLFESGPDEYSPLNGVDLFGKKVKAVYIQSGRFEAGDSLCGYNMRAASKHAAIFYDKLPKNVDLVMSPSNIGDNMDYLPKDVVADLSTSKVNPIKAVYTNYTCDTGQRMWDTNCLVNAVEGDDDYYLSPRGWVTFVDKGEESLMLFREDPNGNARYQVPGDSYFNQQKLMDIRHYNRINNHPADYTIEAPQPILKGRDAVAWTTPRMQQLVDKYLATSANKLDPNDLRDVFRPIGYYGTNLADYQEAEELLEDEVYQTMLDRAVKAGKNNLLIVTGPPACGKSTAARAIDRKNIGVTYDADLSMSYRLEKVVARAEREGFNKVTIMPVYNDIMTCFQNSINRGKTNRRFDRMIDIVNSFRSNIGKLEQIRAGRPDIEIMPIDCSHNQGVTPVTLADALKWKYDVSNDEINAMLTYLLQQIDDGELYVDQMAYIADDILNIGGMDAANLALAKEIDAKVKARLREAEQR